MVQYQAADLTLETDYRTRTPNGIAVGEEFIIAQRISEDASLPWLDDSATQTTKQHVELARDWMTHLLGEQELQQRARDEQAQFGGDVPEDEWWLTKCHIERSRIWIEEDGRRVLLVYCVKTEEGTPFLPVVLMLGRVAVAWAAAYAAVNVVDGLAQPALEFAGLLSDRTIREEFLPVVEGATDALGIGAVALLLFAGAAILRS